MCNKITLLLPSDCMQSTLTICSNGVRMLSAFFEMPITAKTTSFSQLEDKYLEIISFGINDSHTDLHGFSLH